MKLEEIADLERNYTESKIQHICVSWFRQTFPEIAHLLFSVPNGGFRSGRTGAMMTYEGQVRGVSDLILLPSRTGRPPLCIEMKVPKRKGSSAGRQSPEQKEWQKLVESHGNRYVVCHGIEEFARAVCLHLGEDAECHIGIILNKYPLYY